jgi:hypothetical protein
MGNDQERTLAKMRLHKHGWRMRDFESLYSAFGFEKVEGARHVKFKHELLPGRIATITRASGELPFFYAQDAVSFIDALKQIPRPTENEQSDPQRKD